MKRSPKVFAKKIVGGVCDGNMLESTRKPEFGDEFRAGNDLYVYRSGKWRFVKVLLPPVAGKRR